MKLYVAGRFKSYKMIRAVAQHLRELGHQITWDWTITDEFDEHGECKHVKDTGFIDEQQIPPERLQWYAEQDKRGAREADAVVLVWEPDLCGALIEVGVAIGAEKQVLVIAQQRWTVFWRLPQVHLFESLQSFFEYMERAE